MQTTTLGRGGPVVSRAGLGLMGMSGIYGATDDREEERDAGHAARIARGARRPVDGARLGPPCGS